MWVVILRFNLHCFCVW